MFGTDKGTGNELKKPFDSWEQNQRILYGNHDKTSFFTLKFHMCFHNVEVAAKFRIQDVLDAPLFEHFS